MKRRILAILICFILVFSSATPVFAESGAFFVENVTTITSDGSCQVTIRVNVRIEEKVDKLTFPLPLEAKDVMLNNSTASAYKADGALQVDISDVVGGYIGDYSLKFDFRLDKVVRFEEDKYILELPLLSGFAYPVESMDFTITLPGKIQGRPYFTGGYRQSTIESVMNFVVMDNMITGSINAALDDRETLTMTMVVTEDLFPGVSTFQRNGNPEIIPMAIFGALALIYWLVFLRNGPLLRIRRTTAPEGVSAGELGCRLTFDGADLTMMVFHWAQMGYLLIHLDRRDRVILYKRMDMGNERSLFEVKTFKQLFGKRNVVDGCGYGYARLARDVSRQIPGDRAMSSSKNGNMKIFRLLLCLVQLFDGICLAMNMTGNEIVQILLSIVLAIFGALSAWYIQGGMYRIHLRNRMKLWLGLILSVVWVILGLIAGQILIALIPLLAQLLGGLMAAYGGKRSDLGKINATQILGLRHYLRNVDGEELHRLRKIDPEYFFNMVPHALALGVEKRFAVGFGPKKISLCPYFVTDYRGKLDTQGWAQSMRRAANRLDARKKQMEWEKFSVIRVRR